MVEIDPLVVEVCKKYLPKTACCLNDPRLNIYYEDGLKFIRSCEDQYDLIIVDLEYRSVRTRQRVSLQENFMATVIRRFMRMELW